MAAALRGFGPLGILAILIIFAGNLVIIPLSAILVLVWAKMSRTPWREIGYVRSKSWIGALLVNSDDDVGHALSTTLERHLERLGWTVGRNLAIDYRWGLTGLDKAKYTTK